MPIYQTNYSCERLLSLCSGHIKDTFFQDNMTITQHFILKSSTLALFEVVKSLTLILLPK